MPPASGDELLAWADQALLGCLWPPRAARLAHELVIGVACIESVHSLGANARLVPLELRGPDLLLPDLDLHRNIGLQDTNHQVLREILPLWTRETASSTVTSLSKVAADAGRTGKRSGRSTSLK